MAMDKKSSLEDVLGDFSEVEISSAERFGSRGTTLTIWVPEDAKHRYDQLQQRTKRRFGKKLRALFLAAIDVVERQVS